MSLNLKAKSKALLIGWETVYNSEIDLYNFYNYNPKREDLNNYVLLYLIIINQTIHGIRDIETIQDDCKSSLFP